MKTENKYSSFTKRNYFFFYWNYFDLIERYGCLLKFLISCIICVDVYFLVRTITGNGIATFIDFMAVSGLKKVALSACGTRFNLLDFFH